MKISIICPSIRPKGLDVVQESLKNQIFQDFEFLVEIGLGIKPDLNKALNKMLSRATGEVVVMWQDYIKAPKDALQYIVDHYEGHFVTYPVGKTLDWKNIKYDWRRGLVGEIAPNQWEADFASAPLKAFYDVGGYDEDFDRGWSSENVDLAERVELAGYKFFCDGGLVAVAYDHDVAQNHPFRSKKRYEDNLTTLEIKRGL